MNDAAFIRIFNLPFDEATSFFRNKLTIESDAWDDLTGAAHAKAFTSAGAYQAELLAEIRKMTDKAIAGGMDIREFRKQFLPLVEKYGWQLKGGGPAWRSDIIWRTNITTAYQAGRWQQFEDGGIEYLRYDHLDGQMYPRLNHQRLDGMILPIDDPFWTVNYPPNGWRCHCRAVAASEAEYKALPGGKKTRPADWAEMPDNGWRYNVGQAGQEKGYSALTAKLESLPNEIARAWMQRFMTEPAFRRFINQEIKGEFPVAVLQPDDMRILGTENQTVWLSDQTLAVHLERHAEIGLADYQLLPEIIEKGEVYRQEDLRLIYLWKDGKLYRAAVKTTRAKDRNYLLTLFKTNERAAYDEVREKYERIR